MNTRILGFAGIVAAATLVGGFVGAALQSHGPLATVNAATSTPSPTPKSNEAAAHEQGESAAQEAAENNGTARHNGPSNEDPAHEASESAAREASETS